MIKYRVTWDNGAKASGTFPQTFDTFEEASTYGCDWADECNLRDFGTKEPDDEECYSFDVIEVDSVDGVETARIVTDFSVKRVGSGHEEEIRAGRSYCHECGYVDELDSTSEAAQTWHGDSFENVTCSLCGNECPANTAHLHQSKWIGDECCWDDRLKASE